MLSKILQYLQGLLMKNSSGFAISIVIGAVFVICVVGGYISTKYLGKDNVVEQELEQVGEMEAEELLHAPKGSLKNEVDAIFPHNAPPTET